MDTSNGIRTNSYNKMSPTGRDGSDTDMEPTASQSQDCEPTPPLQRHGSKNNFYITQIDTVDSNQTYLGRPSPHNNRSRGLEMMSRSHTPDVDRDRGLAAPSPTMQQRIKAIGVPTPIAMSSPLRRSNPGTPTQPRRPDFISVNNSSNINSSSGPGAGGPGVAGGMIQSPPSYYEYQGSSSRNMLMGGHPHHHADGGGSPQRRFLSEGELLRGSTDLAAPSYRITNTVDNIRELASSPQRGVYLWKDTSPNQRGGPPGGGGMGGPSGAGGVSNSNSSSHQQTNNQYEHFRSNPTSPTQRVYYPALRGGVQVFPPQVPTGGSVGGNACHVMMPSPQVKRKNIGSAGPPATSSQTIDNRRRPMSFVRALEMSDSMNMPVHHGPGSVGSAATAGQQGVTSRSSGNVGGGGGGGNTPTPDRQSVYDINYEISV